MNMEVVFSKPSIANHNKCTIYSTVYCLLYGVKCIRYVRSVKLVHDPSLALCGVAAEAPVEQAVSLVGVWVHLHHAHTLQFIVCLCVYLGM